jgi:hypothetical protein
MGSILNKAIQAAQGREKSFVKYITANDTGATGSHQAGFHIHKNAWQLFFDTKGIRGSNKDKIIKIKWQNDFETESRVVYYGTGTRDEYRLTRFGKRFPYTQDENIGDLLVITKVSDTYYETFILQSDEEIDQFLVALNISSNEINGIIPRQSDLARSDDMLSACFINYINSLAVDFPATLELASHARDCYNKTYSVTTRQIQINPDKEILGWLDTEYQLFKELERNRYSSRILTCFDSVQELLDTANTILNRRKSRAGKSLEHHLAEVFSIFRLAFEMQAETEDKKKPDFLFPNRGAYLNRGFDASKLVFLASKTTCKDRWRQVLNEADKIKTKHLFTLQQGISENQLREMYNSNVCLVVPMP